MYFLVVRDSHTLYAQNVEIKDDKIKDDIGTLLHFTQKAEIKDGSGTFLHFI